MDFLEVILNIFNFNYISKTLLVFLSKQFLGRTGPTKMKYVIKPGETGYYYDFNSLYPSVNYYTKYPIGHPKRKFWNIPVDWSKRIHMREQFSESASGLFKVFVIPPQDTIIPVLPARFDERLLFPLCIRCALSYDHKENEDDDDFFAVASKTKRHNIRKENYECPHNDEERGWVGFKKNYFYKFFKFRLVLILIWN